MRTARILDSVDMIQSLAPYRWQAAGICRGLPIVTYVVGMALLGLSKKTAIASMVLTLLAAGKVMRLESIPGFDRLGGRSARG